MQALDLSWNHFNKPENIEWLAQLSSLEYLDMSTVNLSKVNNWLHVVNKLPYLTSLSLCFCNLPKIFSTRLVNSSSLDYLNLGGNNLTSSSLVLEWLFKSNISVVELYLFENQLQGLISDAFSKINSLAHLYLDSNEFEGEIPKAFGGMCNLKTLSLSRNHLSGQLDLNHNLSGCVKHSLETLDLGQNQVMGSIPNLTAFPSLRELFLFQNRLNGTIPESLGKQSNLESLSLGDNPLEGVISEAHFSKLTKLQILDLSNTLLVFNINSNWIPPFQLKMIWLSSCQLGPRFPKWLQTQNNFSSLDISNTRISDTLSNSYWIFSSQLWFLNLSQNQISGHVPNSSLKFSSSVIDLSSNKLEGEIPRFLFKATHLDLFENMFSKPVQSLCAVTNGNLNLLDLFNNQLSGELPDCWMHFEGLKVLNLAKNQFHGKIPSSMGSLLEIETLDLSDNSFSGELPTLKNCANLIVINLQNNSLSGEIPKWLGSNHPNLIFLFLRSNHFFGSIPSHLCHLIHLQVLDLALNQISGSIPKCLQDVIALTQKWTPNSTITHSFEFSVPNGISSSSYDDHATWMNKGREYEYKSILGLLKSIDLSSNKLTGPIPSEIVELNGLISLNLSRNLLTGKIPSEIGLLRSLEALDLSQNQLCGGIPSSISLIYSLSSLNLSNNNLFGKIPTGSQLNTFNATAYEGNLNLCGFPLPKKCSREDTTQIPTMNTGSGHAGSQKEEDGFVTLGFYVSVTLGFVVGFWGVFGTMVLNRSWRFSYFKFLNNFKDKLYVTGAMIMVKLQRQLQT